MYLVDNDVQSIKPFYKGLTAYDDGEVSWSLGIGHSITIAIKCHSWNSEPVTLKAKGRSSYIFCTHGEQ